VNIERVVYSFFIILALTLNFGFFLGDIDSTQHHNIYELFAAVVVNLIATVLKFGDRTYTGAMLLASSLVADLHLLAAALVWVVTVYAAGTALQPPVMAAIVSLAGGALLANLVSVIVLVVEIVALRR
jgi:Ca2+/H+ antiporter, TMEM165/GDT1 family